MSITPQKIQQLYDELEASRQSLLRAWKELQQIRTTLQDLAQITIPPPKEKSFEVEGALLNQSLRTILSDRNAALRTLTYCAQDLDSASWRQDRRALAEAHKSAKTAIATAKKLLKL